MREARIRTVRGDIPASTLGVAAPHEHIFCDQRLCDDGAGPAVMVLRDSDLIVDELTLFANAGGQAIVDATVFGWGRDVGVLASISERTRIHVIACSGFYTEACMPSFARREPVEQLVEFLVREVEVGCDGTDIRAGLLKSGVSSPRLEGREEVCARAVARAHRLTGIPITTHTSGSVRFHIPGGNAGSMHLQLFEEEGVDPAHVIIGHCDENADIRQLREFASRGAFVQFDVVGKEHWLLDATRIALVLALLDLGHERQILLSSDRNRLSELHAGGGRGYDHVLTNFVPLLRSRGVDEETLKLLLVTNPAAALSIAA